MSKTTLNRLAGCVLAGLALPTMGMADFVDDANWPDLVARLGEGNVPTGLGVAVSQVEAPSGDGSYAPDVDEPAMSPHEFIDRSSGSSGSSGHATLVARRYYGVVESMAPESDPVNLYEVNGWCMGDYLRTNSSSSTPPVSTPGGIAVFNHSWIGSFGSVSNDHLVMRRLDHVVARDDVLMIVGVNNGSTSEHQPLLSHAFNVISVGVRNGNHAHDDTFSSYEGAGRQIPVICATSSATSYAAPIVASAGAMLVEQVRTDPDLHTYGDRPAVVKAVLLGSANHYDPTADDGIWSNDAVESGPDRGVSQRPLDDVQGAGQLDVDRANLIMGGGRIIGGVSEATTPEAPLVGWDSAFCLVGNSRTWNFTLDGSVDEISVVATWDRQVPVGFGTNWTLGDFDLELVSLDAAGNTSSLVGSDSTVFASGNVLSASGVDNVEHLHIRGLSPGRYQLQLNLVAGGGASSAEAGIAWYFSEPVIIDVPGDVNGDGEVNVDDLLQLLSEYGSCTGGCPSDLDGDGDTDVDDLLLLLNYY